MHAGILVLLGAAPAVRAPGDDPPPGLAVLPKVVLSKPMPDSVSGGHWASADDDAYYLVGADWEAVHRFSRLTGQTSWSSRCRKVSPAPPTLSGGRMVVGLLGRGVQAWDTTDGRPLWRVELGRGYPLIGRPSVGGGRVFFATHDRRVVAVDEATGTLLWDAKPSARVQHAGSGDGFLDGGPVAAGGGRAAFLSDMRTLYLLDGRTGRTLRTVTPDPQGRVYHPGAFGGRLVAYSISPSRSALLCYDAGLRELLWTFPAKGTPRSQLPPLVQRRLAGEKEDRKARRREEFACAAAAGGTLYFTWGDHAYAVDIATGRPRWGRRIHQIGWAHTRRLLVTARLVVLGRDEAVTALSRRDGTVAWELRGSRRPRALAAAGSWLYGWRVEDVGGKPKRYFECLGDDYAGTLAALADATVWRGPSDEDVARWIRDLASSEWRVRDHAAKRLAEMGPEAERHVMGIDSDDVEVRTRKRAILEAIRAAEPAPPGAWCVRVDGPTLLKMMRSTPDAQAGKLAAVLRRLFDDDFGVTNDSAAAEKAVAERLAKDGDFIGRFAVKAR